MRRRGSQRCEGKREVGVVGRGRGAHLHLTRIFLPRRSLSTTSIMGPASGAAPTEAPRQARPVQTVTSSLGCGPRADCFCLAVEHAWRGVDSNILPVARETKAKCSQCSGHSADLPNDYHGLALAQPPPIMLHMYKLIDRRSNVRLRQASPCTLSRTKLGCSKLPAPVLHASRLHRK